MKVTDEIDKMIEAWTVCKKYEHLFISNDLFNKLTKQNNGCVVKYYKNIKIIKLNILEKKNMILA